MIKFLLKRIAIYSFSLWLLHRILPGVSIKAGLFTIVIAGIVLTILVLIVKPVLKLLSLPLNIITLGAFSIIIHTFILYLLTYFISEITIKAFRFSGVAMIGISIPAMSINTLGAFFVVAVVLSMVSSILFWIM